MFEGCSKLKSVNIPEGVTRIGEFAFRDCDFNAVTIPNTVKEIAISAFNGNKSLKSVTIPESVTTLDSSAFINCSSLEAINVDTNNTLYCSIDGVLFNKEKTTLMKFPSNWAKAFTFPSSVTTIGDYAFNSCDRLVSYEVPNNITSIGKNAFSSSKHLESINIPNSVTSIGMFCFAWDTALKEITIPGSVSTLDQGTFRDCSVLKSVTLEEGITYIGHSPFMWCTSLKSIVIPHSVTNLGLQALYESFFKNIYYKGTEEEWNNIESLSRPPYIYNVSETTLSFYSETTPTGTGSYWHYVNDVPTIW